MLPLVPGVLVGQGGLVRLHCLPDVPPVQWPAASGMGCGLGFRDSDGLQEWLRRGDPHDPRDGSYLGLCSRSGRCGMNLRDPLATARGLGSAKDGVQHWWMQRLTAIVLALLSPWFIYFAVAQIVADQFQVRNAIAEPLNATLLLGFVIAMMWHARLGLQVVVEDYIH